MKREIFCDEIKQIAASRWYNVQHHHLLDSVKGFVDNRKIIVEKQSGN